MYVCMQSSPQDLSRCDIPVACTLYALVLFAVSLQMMVKRSKATQRKQERQKEKSSVDDEESSQGVQSDGPLHSVVLEERTVGTSEVVREETDRCARLYVCTSGTHVICTLYTYVCRYVWVHFLCTLSTYLFMYSA